MRRFFCVQGVQEGQEAWGGGQEQEEGEVHEQQEAGQVSDPGQYVNGGVPMRPGQG